MSYLYVYDLNYNNIDDDGIINYDYHCNFNDRKTKLFNKLKNLNSDIVNYDLLSLNLLKVECDKEYSLFVKNKDFIINNQIFLSFVKHIIENNNEFVDMLNMNVNLKVINVSDEILKFKLKNNIILYPSPKKLSQITNSFSEILKVIVLFLFLKLILSWEKNKPIAKTKIRDSSFVLIVLVF